MILLIYLFMHQSSYLCIVTQTLRGMYSYNIPQFLTICTEFVKIGVVIVNITRGH